MCMYTKHCIVIPKGIHALNITSGAVTVRFSINAGEWLQVVHDGSMIVLRLSLVSYASIAFLASVARCDLVEVEVDPHNGNDTMACCLGVAPDEPSRKPCKTLSFAFTHCSNDSTMFKLSDDQHCVNESVPSFVDLKFLSIVADFRAIVNCDIGAGLAFVNVSNLTIINIVFQNCAALRNSTSRNFSDTDNPNALSRFYVGLYFYLCNTVSMDSTTIQYSPNATGVVMYDTTGEVSISYSNFSGNSVPDPSNSVQGGGGFYVEFTYCAPGDTCVSSNTDLKSMRNSTKLKANYVFNRCSFVNNIASQLALVQFIPNQANHVAFGRGGGLSLFFNGDTTGNQVNISHCNFISNKAVYGGGLFVEFHDAATGNIVRVENSKFENNSVPFQFNTTGGGARISHFVLSDGINGTGNNVTYVLCMFHSNTGYYGGGVSIEPALQDTKKEVATFSFVRCTFHNNFARLGSAVYIASFSLITNGSLPIINFNQVEVTSNTIFSDSASHYYGYGTFYVNGVPANFKRRCKFENNTGSALAVVGTNLNFSSCAIYFSGNIGQKGGAIALLGGAWILIDSFTKMSFVNNMALSFGGAIFNLYIQQESFETSTNCFIKYADPIVTADRWKAHFLFSNNSDGFGKNSIHSTSILPCSGMNCADEISSDAAKVSFPLNASMYPGEVLKLPLVVTDDLGHNVLNQTTFLGTFINTTDGLNVTTNLMYITSGYILISGSGSGNTTLSMEGVGNGQLQVTMPIHVMQCPPGLINSDSTCICDPTGDYGSTVLCLGPHTVWSQHNAPAALLRQGYWMGTSPENNVMVVGICPTGYCDGASSSYLLGQYIKLPHSLDNLNDVICSGNRTGVLCGSCKSGYAPVINSDQYLCVQCDSSTVPMSILKYIGTEYVPLTVFFLAIILCNVRLTTGPANAFIVFSQVISSTFDLSTGITTSHTAGVLNKSYTLIYSIFNLNFFSHLLSPFCISERFDTLGIVSLSYVVALYPLVMICLMIIVFKIKSIIGCCKSNRCQNSISPMMAITCFLLLSYNKLILTAASILSIGSLRDSNGLDVDSYQIYIQGNICTDDSYYKWYYASVAAILLSITSVLPVVLLGHPVTLLEKCLSYWPMVRKWYPADKVNIFLDCFQGSFENNRRFFASLYFMFRLGITMSYILPISEINERILQLMISMVMLLLVAVLQPYKERLTNCWDCFVFFDLAAISSLSMYMLENQPLLLLIVIQFILIMLPLLCIVGYSVWSVLPPSVKQSINVYCSFVNCCKVGTRERYFSYDASHEEDDMLIDRAQDVYAYTVSY